MGISSDEEPMFKALQKYVSKFLSPTRIFVLSFLALIFLGSILLYLPSSSTRGLSYLDALFMATSAVCVTGLAVLDVGTDLTLSGQITLLTLFQTGGLGIITFSAFLFSLMGKGISFKGHEILQSSFLYTPTREFFLVLRWVIVSTLTVESMGALLLFLHFLQELPVARALYYAVFHSISSFNNSGFSLFPDSLIRYQGDLLLNLTIMSLIVIGGIGFVVNLEVLRYAFKRKQRISLHSKVAVVTTFILVLGGAALFYVLEREYELKGLSINARILASFFQSVTSRTAGFNTVDIGGLTNGSVLLLTILMFIGASPGSTGGGIKTTSFALISLLIWNRWRGIEEVNVFNRTIPREVISRTISIIFASALSILIIVCVVLVAGRTGDISPLDRGLYVKYFFETVSAFGTVGLSMGITPKLNEIQKISVALMMFTGRVGPLTFAFFLSVSMRKRSPVYAEEGVMVG